MMKIELFPISLANCQTKPVGEAIQSSTYKSENASLAVDGIYYVTYPGFSHTEIGDEERWWQVDFGQTTVILEVSILNRDACRMYVMYMGMQNGM